MKVNIDATLCKANLLSMGIAIDPTVLMNYNPGFIEKRRAYGIQDPPEYLDKVIPQELVIKPDNIVCAININPSSPWVLKYREYDGNYIVQLGSIEKTVAFPLRPLFYGKAMRSDPKKKVNQIISMYGGHSIGAFLLRNCFYENNGVCHFCSLNNNHGKSNDFLDIISTKELTESIEIALEEDYPITQIMLNGGTLFDSDDNFGFYLERVVGVRELLNDMGRKDLELHLIISPPKNLEMIESLRGLDLKIAMNMEVFDANMFAKYCPGKNSLIGHGHTHEALLASVDVLGSGNVFSIIVGGLESLSSLKNGIDVFCSEGILPVINVLHIDPNTLMSDEHRPTVDYILSAGKCLQEAYSKFPISFVPFYKDCGRNSIDTEAFRKLF